MKTPPIDELLHPILIRGIDKGLLEWDKNKYNQGCPWKGAYIASAIRNELFEHFNITLKQNEQPELKPCPFCGGKGDLMIKDIGTSIIRYNCIPIHYIVCGSCNISTGLFITEGLAVESWNKRPQPVLKQKTPLSTPRLLHQLLQDGEIALEQYFEYLESL